MLCVSTVVKRGIWRFIHIIQYTSPCSNRCSSIVMLMRCPVYFIRWVSCSVLDSPLFLFTIFRIDDCSLSSAGVVARMRLEFVWVDILYFKNTCHGKSKHVPFSYCNMEFIFCIFNLFCCRYRLPRSGMICIFSFDSHRIRKVTRNGLCAQMKIKAFYVDVFGGGCSSWMNMVIGSDHEHVKVASRISRFVFCRMLRGLFRFDVLKQTVMIYVFEW